jgi:hypothetical protein
MKISSAFPSDYLKAADLRGRDVTVTMDSVKIETVGRDKESLPVLYFRGKDKGLVLNKTNARKIAEAFGDDTDDWSGGEIILYEAMVEFQGNTGPALRVRLTPPRRDNGKQSPNPTPSRAEQGFDDDAPF